MQFLKKLYVLPLLVILMGSPAGAAIDIVGCNQDTSCDVKIYRSDVPILMAQHSIQAQSAIPIPASNVVTIVYEGVGQSITCDGTWQSINSTAGLAELQNSISCTVNADRDLVYADLVLFEQNSYDNPYSAQPSQTGYPGLDGTSAALPVCQQETSPDTATACEWESLINGQWIVFGRTTVTHLALGTEIPEGQPGTPLDIVCGEDINGNGELDSSEFGPCAETPQGPLCLVDAVMCAEASADPICPAGGALNTATDLCEQDPTISCPSPTQVYDNTLGQCIDITQCADICPVGYTYDSNNYICRAPACVAPSIYNAATNRCEIVASFTCPVDELNYNDQTSCEAACKNFGTCTGTGLNNVCMKAYGIEGGPQGPWEASLALVQQFAGSLQNGQCDTVDPISMVGMWFVGCSQSQNEVAWSHWPNELWDTTNWVAKFTVTDICPGSVWFQIDGTIPFGGGLPQSIPDGRQLIACAGEYWCPWLAFYGGSGLNWQYIQFLYYGNPASYSCSFDSSVYGTSQDCQDNCSQTVACLSGCPTGYTVSGSLCITNPSCSFGGTLNTTTGECELAPDYTSSGCTTDPDQNCDPGYTYSPASGKCEAVPICDTGAYDPVSDICVGGPMLCPYDPNRECREYQGQLYCSPYDCVSVDGNIINNDTTEGLNDKQNDGATDPNTGECLGKLYFFTGKDRRCRTDGVTTAWTDCCKDDDYLFGMVQCEDKEIELAEYKSKGFCHYIGEYCSQEINLLVGTMCIEHKKTYCCFKSKLGRIFQEQGRAQLTTIDWGTPKAPECRGFTEEEFSMLDFNEMDLSEIFSDIQTNSQQQIGTTMNQNITDNF